MSSLEILGTILGVIGVALMIRQNVWGWPVGIVQVSVYAWVFHDAKLYSDAILQGFFCVIQAYGWWHWIRGGTHSVPLPVSRLSVAAVVSYVILGAAATFAWGRLMATKTDAALPFFDAFILVFSLISQWLQARKKLECWPGWLLVNTVSIGVFWAKDLRITAFLYVLFWGMAAWGWLAWQKSRHAPAVQRA
jgi:nicotinamide mononucleotide transporter